MSVLDVRTPWVGEDAVDGSGTLAAEAPPAAPVHRPGLLERILVVAATFILYHQTPNAWSLTVDDIDADYSNSAAVIVQLGLIALALSRIVGSVDVIVDLIRSELSVFAFTVLTFLSVFWSADPSESFRRSVMFIAVTGLAVYLVVRFALAEIVDLLAWMFVVSAVINVTWIVLYPEYGVDGANRFTGVFPQKNGLGYVGALAVSTLVIAALNARWLRPVFGGAALVHAALILGSESKTMLVAGFLPVILMVVYQKFRSRRTLAGAVFLSLAGSGLFSLAFATANLDVLARWLDKDVSLTGRIPLWESLAAVALERPFVGHGWAAAFGGYFSPVHEVWIQSGWEPGDAHNALLQIWLELGLVGVVLFGWLFGRSLVGAIRIVAIVSGPIGLWPLVMLTIATLVSVTESGVQSDYLGWAMFAVAVLSVGSHLKHRAALGLSNEISHATEANRLKIAAR